MVEGRCAGTAQSGRRRERALVKIERGKFCGEERRRLNVVGLTRFLSTTRRDAWRALESEVASVVSSDGFKAFSFRYFNVD
jgi:hypothetical protein